MANTKELRRRIKSIKNTSQITKAMQMVSATKMRKAQNQALSARPYSSILIDALALALSKISADAHPLLCGNGVSKTVVVVLSSDKGLCGSLNANIYRALSSESFLGGRKDIAFYTVGKKGRDFVVRTGKELLNDFENTDKVHIALATNIRKILLTAFKDKEIGEAYVLYPHFISTLRQEAKLVKIFPLNASDLRKELGIEEVKVEETPVSEFLLEPSADIVLQYALFHLIDTKIYQALLETKAAEHSARMMAMQNATDNAKDLVSDLTLTYNQVRQEAITKELSEIASASAALEGN